MSDRKLLRVADVRKRMDAYHRGEISHGRAVELLNEDVNRALDDKEKGNVCNENQFRFGQMISENERIKRT